MTIDELSQKISKLERENKQLLLKLNRTENELRELKRKFRSIKLDVKAFQELTSNRKFG